MNCKDSNLVQKARCGEEKAFDILVQKYWEWAFAIASGLVDDFAAAQDVVQEAFINAWQKLVSVQNPYRAAPCKDRIVINGSLLCHPKVIYSVSLKFLLKAIGVVIAFGELTFLKQIFLNQSLIVDTFPMVMNK